MFRIYDRYWYLFVWPPPVCQDGLSRHRSPWAPAWTLDRLLAARSLSEQAMSVLLQRGCTGGAKTVGRRISRVHSCLLPSFYKDCNKTVFALYLGAYILPQLHQNKEGSACVAKHRSTLAVTCFGIKIFRLIFFNNRLERSLCVSSHGWSSPASVSSCAISWFLRLGLLLLRHWIL